MRKRKERGKKEKEGGVEKQGAFGLSARICHDMHSADALPSQQQRARIESIQSQKKNEKKNRVLFFCFVLSLSVRILLSLSFQAQFYPVSALCPTPPCGHSRMHLLYLHTHPLQTETAVVVCRGHRHHLRHHHPGGTTRG